METTEMGLDEKQRHRINADRSRKRLKADAESAVLPAETGPARSVPSIPATPTALPVKCLMEIQGAFHADYLRHRQDVCSIWLIERDKPNRLVGTFRKWRLAVLADGRQAVIVGDAEFSMEVKPNANLRVLYWQLVGPVKELMVKYHHPGPIEELPLKDL